MIAQFLSLLHYYLFKFLICRRSAVVCVATIEQFGDVKHFFVFLSPNILIISMFVYHSCFKTEFIQRGLLTLNTFFARQQILKKYKKVKYSLYVSTFFTNQIFLIDYIVLKQSCCLVACVWTIEQLRRKLLWWYKSCFYFEKLCSLPSM